MPLAPGYRFGPYEVIAPLGAGGMGEVYRARDPRLGRDIALKILASRDPDRQRRFDQEARAIAALNHPNICAIYDVGPDYIAMELVDGAPLRPDPNRGIRALLDIAVQTADGLAAAHSAGILHRDLKPENVLLTRDGRVKILDFGLARPLARANPLSDETQAITTTTPGTILGTVAYMSPEQARGDRELDCRSDQFSFGLLLYELLSGKRAFTRPTAPETLTAIIREDPEPLPASAPAPLRWTTERCLAKEPAQRYDTTRDLYLELKHLRDRISEATISGSIAVSPPATRRRRGVWAAAAAGVALAFAGGYALRASRPRSVEPPKFRRATFREGEINGPFLTPDGRTAVYRARWTGSAADSYETDTASGETRPLGLAENQRIAAVSSKGELALLTPSADRPFSTLSRRPLSGGAPRDILDGVVTADWAPDGENLAVVRAVVGAEGARNRLEFPIGKGLYDADGYLFALSVSPDARRIAALEFSIQGAALLIVSVADKAVRRIALVGSEGAALGWAPDGSEVWMGATYPPERGTLFAYSLTGQRRVLARLPGNTYPADIGRSGRVLVQSNAGRAILRFQDAQGADRDLAWMELSSYPHLSMDGRMVLFTEMGEGGGPAYTAYLRKTDGSPPVRLGPGMGAYLTPDARWAFVPEFQTTPYRARLVPTGAGEERPLMFPGMESAYVRGALPDGKTFILMTKEPEKPAHCWLWNPDAGTRAPLVDGSCVAPIVDSSGTRILYQSEDRAWHWKDLRTGGGAGMAAGLLVNERPLQWRSDGRSVFTMRNPAAESIWSVDVETGRRELFKKLTAPDGKPASQSVEQVAITPDGQAWAYSYYQGVATLYVMEGLR